MAHTIEEKREFAGDCGDIAIHVGRKPHLQYHHQTEFERRPDLGSWQPGIASNARSNFSCILSICE